MSNANGNGKKRFALAMKIMMEKAPTGLSEKGVEEFKREQLRKAYAVINPHPHVTRVNNGSKGRVNNASRRASGSKGRVNNHQGNAAAPAASNPVKKWEPVNTSKIMRRH